MLLPALNLVLIKVLAWHYTRNAAAMQPHCWAAMLADCNSKSETEKLRAEKHGRTSPTAWGLLLPWVVWAAETAFIWPPTKGSLCGWRPQLSLEITYSLAFVLQKKKRGLQRQRRPYHCSAPPRKAFSLKWNDIMKMTYLGKLAVLWWISFCWCKMLFHRATRTSQHKSSPHHKALVRNKPERSKTWELTCG